MELGRRTARKVADKVAARTLAAIVVLMLAGAACGSAAAQDTLKVAVTQRGAWDAGIAELGVVFLFFLIGLELSLQRLMTMRRLVFGLGGLQVLVTTALLAGVALHFGKSPSQAIILGTSLSLSSTAIVLEILSKQERLKTNVGSASFTVLLAQDLVVIPLLIFISLLAAGPRSSVFASISNAVVQAAIALTVIILFGRFLLRPLFRLVASTRSRGARSITGTDCGVETGLPSSATIRNEWPVRASRCDMVALAFKIRNNTLSELWTRMGSPAPSILLLIV